MNANTLMKLLQSVDPDTEVRLFWDGADRGDVEAVYISQAGAIVLAGEWSEPDGYDQSAAKPKTILFEAEREEW
jgi:hypothetical protein